MAGDHISGLLNLATLSTGMSLAYIGLDKFSFERKITDADQAATRTALNDALRPKIEKILEIVERQREGRKRLDQSREKLTEMHVPVETLPAKPSRVENEYVVLLHLIAETPPPKHETTFLFSLKKLWYAPPSKYFASGADLNLFAALSALSTVAFLIMSAGTIWEMRILNNELSAGILLALFSSIVAAVIVHTIFRYRINSMPESAAVISQKLGAEVQKRAWTKEQYEAHTEKADEAHRAATDALEDFKRQFGEVFNTAPKKPDPKQP